MTKVVDARGLPCPQPVLLTKKAMEGSDDILTIVDSPDQAENVSRMAEKAGWSVHVDGKEDGIYVRVTRQQAAEARRQPTPEEVMAAKGVGGGGRPLVLVVPSELMGRGPDQELGDVLMRGFFHTLLEVEPRPDCIVFFNTGVKLVVQGSPVVDDLRELASRGVEVLACGTCLGYFGLKDRVAVGTVSNMYTIAETLLGAARLVSL